MSSRVRVLRTTHVHPAQATGTSRPLHAAGADDHKLSFLDTIHIAKIPIQRLFFFDGADLPPFPSIVSSLQTSLAATLAVYLPLAGEMAYRAASDDVVIDCSPGAVSKGVRFVEAEYSGSADDMRRLASDDEHDTEAFVQLVPELEAKQLPAPVLAVQVTRPAEAGGGGGDAVAVGVSMLHAVADGKAVWSFMRAWSSASHVGSFAAAPELLPPTFDRTAIRHPKADELSRAFLRFLAPALPRLRSSSSTLDITQQSRRTFVLSADQIQSLKQHISQAGAASGQPVKPPTTYVAVSSLVWAAMVRAKPQLNHADDAHFMVTADCRRRLRPPLGEGFFGNCICPYFARANIGDLRGDAGGLAHAAAAIQRAIREGLEEEAAAEDPLAGMERLMEVYARIPKDRYTAVGSSHRFMAYETDFGWGAPRRVELVSMFQRELVTLLGARGGGGGVQVSAALDRTLMEAFVAKFVVPPLVHYLPLPGASGMGVRAMRARAVSRPSTSKF